MQHASVTLILLTASAISLVSAGAAYGRRADAGSSTFALLMLAIAGWSMLSALHSSAADLALRVSIAKLQYVPIVSVAPLWLLVTLAVIGAAPLPRRRLAALALIPMLTLALAWTNERHGLIWAAIVPAGAGQGAPLVYRHGPWFWVAAAYSYGLLLLANLLLARAARGASAIQRPQLLVLLVAGCLPWLGNALYLSGAALPPGLDLTPIAFTLTGVVTLWGLYRHQIFELVPIARGVLIDHMVDGVIVLDPRQQIVDYNPAASRHGGLSAGALGQALALALPAWAAPIGAAIASGRPELVDLAGPPRLSLEMSASRLSGRRGQTIGWLVVLRDVTAQREAEARRAELEQQLRAERDFALQIMQTMGEGLTVTDSAGRFAFVNNAYARMFGYQPADLIGRSPAELTLEEDREALAAARALRDQGLPSTYLSRLRCADGRVATVQITGTPRVVDGALSGSVAVITDLTERLSLERQVLEAQRMESIGTLAGGVAHDFNNLLMAVLGHADLLRLDLPPDSAAAESVEAIIAGARRAAELTGQLLAYAGRGRFVIEQVALNELLREMAGLLQASLPPQARVRYRLAASLPPVEADVRQLRQVALNLLANAGEALDGPGQISVETAVVTFEPAEAGAPQPGGEPRAGRYVRLTVCDSGRGMDPATLARIFEPFFSTKFTGRGLGLSAVQGIVRAHGGALQVESLVGKGTCVQVWLPVAGGGAAQLAPVGKYRHIRAGALCYDRAGGGAA